VLYCYYTIIHLIHYTIIIIYYYYYILYYTLLFFIFYSPVLPLLLQIFPIFRTHFPFFLFPILFSSFILPNPTLPNIPSPHSRNTCRYLHALIYILFRSFPITSLLSPSHTTPPHLSSSHPFPSLSSSIFLPILFSLIYLSIHSILVGTYIYLFIFFPIFNNNLTPHVLSEWMVEVWCV